MDFPSFKLTFLKPAIPSVESNENAVVENFFSELNKFEESLQDFYRKKEDDRSTKKCSSSRKI